MTATIFSLLRCTNLLCAHSSHVCPVRVVAMYALQSVAYIPASDWVRKLAMVDLHEAQGLWKAAWNPKFITLAKSDQSIPDHKSEKGTL